jgi:predicted nucleotidyltransferase
VWVFGSRATRNGVWDYSDLDLLFSDNIDVGELKEAFDLSRLPYKVDLVVDKKLSPIFKENIEKEKIPLEFSDGFDT